MKQRIRQLLRSLLWWGALRRVRKDDPEVIVIAGTVGKTSTKEALGMVLRELSDRPLLVTPGNLGSDFGVPLTILGFHDQLGGWEWLKAVGRAFLPPKVLSKGVGRSLYVLEFSADAAGDTAFLCSHIQPDHVILTALTATHMMSYATEADLIHEETAAYRMVRPGGVVVVNGEDSELAKLKKVEQVKLGTTTPTERGLRYDDYEFALYGAHQLLPVLLATRMAERMGVEPAKSLALLAERYTVPPGRGKIIAGKQGVTILDDTYNSSPAAAAEALRGGRAFSGKRLFIAVLGRMNELGDHAEKYHEELGRVAGKHVDVLVSVGQHAELVAEASGLPAEKIVLYPTAEALLEDKKRPWLQKDAVVLVKGSQNQVRLERFVKQIMKDPEQAGVLLCRQEAFWL